MQCLWLPTCLPRSAPLMQCFLWTMCPFGRENNGFLGPDASARSHKKIIFRQRRRTISQRCVLQDTCCQMHSAALYHFYWRWRTQKRSIEHTELTFNEVRCSILQRRSSIEPPETCQVRALLFRRPAKLLEMLLGV